MTSTRKAIPLEKALGIRFRMQLLDTFPDAFVYKIPDTFGMGGMRPFDCIAIITGETFCFEFKRGGNKKPTLYQAFHLNKAQANGAHAFVVNEVNCASILKAVTAIVTWPGGSK